MFTGVAYKNPNQFWEPNTEAIYIKDFPWLREFSTRQPICWAWAG